jgi:hypothetical protein
MAARWMDSEAAALAERLEGVPRFAATIPMVQEARPDRLALERADAVINRSRRLLGRQIRDFRKGFRARLVPSAELHVQHRRYVVLRSRFNSLLGTVDVFADALTQRAEHGIGVALRGLDALAADGLRTEPQLFDPPPLVCYLDRGLGGAIRRAFTTLPGGERNAVALVKLPRERLFGNGLASLLHEVGHQGIASLNLLPPYAAALRAAAAEGRLSPRIGAWWVTKLNEVLPDIWACAKLGAAGTLGLMAVMGNTPLSVFYDDPSDPHPMPWIRPQVSAAFGASAMPHPIWAELQRTWLTLYPLRRGLPHTRRLAREAQASLPVVSAVIACLRPPQLRGQTLPQALGSAGVAPARLLPKLDELLVTLNARGGLSPCHALAVIALARRAGLATPTEEDALLRRLVRAWAAGLGAQGDTQAQPHRHVYREVPNVGLQHCRRAV